MHLKMANFVFNVYRDKILKKGEPLDELLKYIPKKEPNSNYKDGIFVKDNKIIRDSISLGHPVWAIIDTLLGRVPEARIAWFFGIPIPYIEMRERALRIYPYDYFDYSTLDPLFKYGTDEDIAKLYNGELSEFEVQIRREFVENKGKESVNDDTYNVPWTVDESGEVKLISKETEETEEKD